MDLSSNDSLLNGELSSLQQQHPNLVFVGSQPDPLLNLDADYPVLIVPSNYGEGLPRAVLEAFSLGIPVISSRSATCGIFSEANVYISSGDDPGDYVSCFDQLLADHGSGRLQSRLQDCRNLVEQQLSESAVVQQTMNVYQSLQREQAESYLIDQRQRPSAALACSIAVLRSVLTSLSVCLRLGGSTPDLPDTNLIRPKDRFSLSWSNVSSVLTKQVLTHHFELC